MGGVFGSHGGGVFPEEGILAAVQMVFDTPVSAVIGEQLYRGGLCLPEAGDETDLLGSGFSGFLIGAAAGDASPLPESRPFYPPHLCQFDAARLDASVPAAGFLMRLQEIFFVALPAPRV